MADAEVGRSAGKKKLTRSLAPLLVDCCRRRCDRDGREEANDEEEEKEEKEEERKEKKFDRSERERGRRRRESWDRGTACSPS